MSNAKKKKYANKMRNQPANVSFTSDWDAGHSTQHHYPQGGASPHQRAEYHSSPDQRRYAHSSHGPPYQQEQFPFRGSYRGRGGPYQALQTPKFITATKFAEARAAEISVMLKTVTRKSTNCQLFQSLPKHMRRRAMGHDVKRLPRRLREMAKNEMEKVASQKKEKSKSKCRKARRRHGNLQQEFNRRQRKNIWLETHIWHAKRFHMVKKWGYCLGDKPTAKCYRACFRAMTSHCLLQDVSYYCCLELVGKEEELLKALARLSNADAGPTFAAAHHLSGKRQGALVLYKADKYPHEVLGPVTFFWKPSDGASASSELRQLWIWAHPTLKQDILAEFQKVFKYAENMETTICVGQKRKRMDEEGESAVPVKKILGDGTRDPLKQYSWESQSTGVVISDLTMEIVRYRLIGPLSHCVLAEALKAASLHKEMGTSVVDPHCWWTEYCNNTDNVSLHNRQEDAFQLLQGVRSPAEVPAGTILGLTTGDPRLNLPKKMSKAMPDLKTDPDKEKVKKLTLEGAPVECARSLLWNQTVRTSVTENKISEQDINRLRRELLVPGSKLELGASESKIPVLLIQQPGKVAGEDRRGWGAGWDICLPKGWGMAFWISFIYRGARIGGLQEGFNHSLNKGTAHVPNDFPDCPAGVQAAREVEANLLEKYKRRPPAKRTNYVKHGSLAPFLCPWKQLTQDWEVRNKAEKESAGPKGPGSDTCEARRISSSQDLEPTDDDSVEMEINEAVEKNACLQDDSRNVLSTPNSDTDQESRFCVLRCRRILKRLSSWCRPSSGKFQQVHHSSKPLKQTMTPVDTESLMSLYPRSLVWIRLSLLKKGTPEIHSMICIPTKEDMLQLSRDKLYCGPQEPKHSDIFKHKVLKLKKMKKKNKKNRKHAKTIASGSADGDFATAEGDSDPTKGASGTAESTSVTAEGASGSVEGNSETLKENITTEVEDLTLGLWPDPLPDVSSHCSRAVFGFVTRGDFSLAVGCGEAVGFVSLTGLLHMLARQPTDRKGLVLVRNPTSLQYRFAELIIDV